MEFLVTLPTRRNPHSGKQEEKRKHSVYSNKENVNILTALLVAHGISDAVVCPGSRNAPIVHNLDECPQIACHPVTDERSAGFYALGMAQASGRPVVVCVTSGSALLNVVPAVAEACYQHVPLVVVSADRPQQWIGQLDGQTLPQPGAFGPFVALSVTLPEPRDSEERWYCNRLVNEALLKLPSCIHINVPISEPLFEFATTQLPSERNIVGITPGTDYDCLHPDFINAVANAERPMIVFGQLSPRDFTGEGTDYLFSHIIVLHESLSPMNGVSHFDEVIARLQDNAEMAVALQPDVVVHVGGATVSKRLKRLLRSSNCEVWRISSTPEVEDTFQHLRGIVVGDPEAVLQSLSYKLSKVTRTNRAAMDYRRMWLHLLSEARNRAAVYAPPYSQMAVIKIFEQELQQHGAPIEVHYANSSAIRLANIYARHHVWCNRGVNGIEGSLSTAAGFSLATDTKTCCIIGDLSFFYDQNALWNTELGGNLRILLLNNGGGGIFSQLPGLERSKACQRLVAAAHQTSARGICEQHHIGYFTACDMSQLQTAINHLLYEQSSRPVLLEVLTTAEADREAITAYLA